MFWPLFYHCPFFSFFFFCSSVRSFLSVFADPAPVSVTTTKYNVKNKNLLLLPFNWLTYYSLPDFAWENVYIGSSGLCVINSFVCFCGESDQGTCIKNNNIEIANLLTVGLICLCRSFRGISIKLRMFHNQFKNSM